jgi:hypothetical protein
MRRLGCVVAVSLWLVISVAARADAQVTISYPTTYCQIGQECTLNVKINSGVGLGRLAVVLYFKNSQIQVTGLVGGGYMPVQNKLRFTNDILVTWCGPPPPPGANGQIEYLGFDSGDASTGYGTLFTITYKVTATTSLGWGPAPPPFCAGNSLQPAAQPYDRSTSYSMSYSAGTINAMGAPIVDSDGDGIPDVLERASGTDPNDGDTDDDGLGDGDTNTEDANADGVVDPGETDPRDADSDDDGIFDGTERGLTAPETADTDVGAGHFVADADPLTTTDPNNSDSDGDGVPDGIEDVNRNGAYEPSQGESDPEDDGSQPDPQPVSTSARVLLLGDDGAELQVQPALEAAGFDVTLVDYYHDWDGVTPDVNDFDVVVLLDGYDYGYELEEAAGDALQAFVAKGCGFVMTEWTVYDVCYEYKTGAIVDLIPVTSAPDCDYDDDLEWLVTGTHALTSSVPTSWTDEATSSFVDPYPGTIVLMRTPDGVPLLSFSTELGGTVVHLNHTMSYYPSTIEPNALQLMVNAVGFAAWSCPLFTNAFESGNCDSWSTTVGLVP